MKKLKLNLQSLNAEVLTRSQLKQILGGDGGSGEGDCTGCMYGSKCFYSGPDGCGYATCAGTDGSGGCNWNVHITTPPPCGWA